MLAAGVQNGQHHQVRVGEQPLFYLAARCFNLLACGFDLLSGGLGGAGNEAEMLISGGSAQVLEANPGENRNLLRGEDLLARLYDCLLYTSRCV